MEQEKLGFKVHGKVLLAKCFIKENKTESGLYIPEKEFGEDRKNHGVIIACGEEHDDFKPGMEILWSPHSGRSISIDNYKDIQIVRYEDVLISFT